MHILAVDPGETSGVVLIDFTPALGEGEYIVSGGKRHTFAPPAPPYPIAWTTVAGSFRSVVLKFQAYLKMGSSTDQPSHLVVEDYRIYKDKAALHTGRHLWTVELIGALHTLAVLRDPPCDIHVMAAQAKGRWPSKRMERYFPRMVLKAREAMGNTITPVLGNPHTKDAFRLGLTWLEKGKLWTPVLP